MPTLTPDQQERLYELARRDRQHAEKLDNPQSRFRSAHDPIDAELCRIRCELYCALAAGEWLAEAFEAHYERAKAAVARYNAYQERRAGKPDWRTGIAGYVGEGEAWSRLHHAREMYRKIVPH